MKKLTIIILAIVVTATPGYACGEWVLSHSQIAGGRYGKLVNFCSYQTLTGSGETLSVQLPTSTKCPILLDPCPEQGTEIVINQDIDVSSLEQEKPMGNEEMRRQWQEDYDEFLQLNPDRK